MSTAALAGKQAVIQIGSGGPPPTLWEEIVEVYDIGELPVERAIYDVTGHSASFYRETIAGMYVISSLTMGVNYVNEQYEMLFSKIGEDDPALAIDYYRLLYPDNYYHEFQANVTNVTPVTPLDDRLTYNLTLTISGAITTGTLS